MDLQAEKDFSEVSLGESETFKSLPEESETFKSIESNPKTLVISHDDETESIPSDPEEHPEDNKFLRLRQHGATERHRPSFTIGGSDSDSTVTSVESYLQPSEKQRRHTTHLQPIQSSTHNSRTNSPSNRSRNSLHDVLDAAGDNGSSSKLVPKPGYMGGSTSSSRSPSRHSEVNLNLRDDYDSHRDNSRRSIEEVRLFATEGSAESFTRRQWMTFVVFGFVEFFSAIIISLQAPIYPPEAEKKGASATEYAAVFGVFELTVFIISPIYGSRISKIGSKLVFNLGIFTTAISCILFGFLDQIDDRSWFVGLSILTRIIEALGESAFITASFVIIANEFPQSVATTFALMETFYGFGLVCGPLVGSLLFQLGGYNLPFLTVGSLLFLAALFTTCALPSTRESNISDDPTGGFQMFKLLKIPAIALSAFSIFSAASSMGYLNATLEPHIRVFNLTYIETGAIFIVSGGVYALSSPICGLICDKISQLKYVNLLGSIFILVGFGLIGPIPYVPLETTLWGVIVGQVLQGIGLGAVLVSAFIQGLRDAIKHGYADDIVTYGLVSGIWTSMLALGCFVGPITAGVLYDFVGFRMGTLSIVGLMSLVILFLMISICCSSDNDDNGYVEEYDERRPLLRSNSSRSYDTVVTKDLANV